ncbi:MAG TPA: CNNM domain-containing protein [Euzebyales bacterium]|nr:CNNM domain-containing protein [Euzebyales bacterium]
MTTTLWLLTATAVVLLVLAAVFETAAGSIARTSAPRAEKLTADRVPGAEVLLRLVTELPQTLAVLSLLTTVLRTAYVVTLVVVAVDLVGAGAGPAAGAVVAVLTLYVVADVVPARLVATQPERMAARLARIVRWPVVALGPVARLMGRVGSTFTPGDDDHPPLVVTTEQLRDLVDVAGAEGTLTASRYAMLIAVFDIDDTVVREVMVPRPDMISVASKAPLDEVVEVILAAGHSRIPVHGDDRDEIEGIIYAKDILALLHTGEIRPWTELMRPPLVVPELKSVEELLRELQVAQVHLAVVVDEYGATVGLITIEDILEELVGEIVDEYDEELPLVEVLDDDRWRVDARLPVDDLAELVDTRLPDDEWDTVGGLLFGLLGHIATPGERVAVDGIQLTAEQIRGRRIAQVLVERCDDEAAES